MIARVARDARSASRTTASSSATCARERVDRRAAARAGRDARSTSRRCPAPRDQLTQRVPMGSVIKCMAIYDEPFWREDGLSGHGDQPARPGAGGLRQHAAERLARRADGLPRGPRRPRPGPGARGRAPRGRGRQLRPPVRRARGEPHRLRREGLVERALLARLLRGRPDARHLDRLRPRPARADRPHPLGRAPRPRPAGWATSTARSRRAGGPRPRCWPPRAPPPAAAARPRAQAG